MKKIFVLFVSLMLLSCSEKPESASADVFSAEQIRCEFYNVKVSEDFRVGWDADERLPVVTDYSVRITRKDPYTFTNTQYLAGVYYFNEGTTTEELDSVINSIIAEDWRIRRKLDELNERYKSCE